MKYKLEILILGFILSVINFTFKREHHPTFGRSLKSNFLLDPNFVYLNHGSYGTYPKAVQTALHEYQARAESNPDLWMRLDLKEELTKVREALAKVVGAASEDIVMVPNTTGGINAIFRSMVFEFGERILHFSTIYGSMGSLIQYIVDYSNGAVSSLVFNVTYPLSNEDLVHQFEQFLIETHDPSKPIRIALIDHITSVPGVIVPIERIIPMLKQRNITVLIDGAHAIGQVPINLTQLEPDYYITNCHKWLYAARGAAMLYVDKKHQSTIHPAHINANYKQPGDFQNEFFWTGTMDYSPYMTVPAALKFREEFGGEEAVREYNHQLAIRVGNYLASKFGTRVLQDEDQIGSMVDVLLPLVNPEDPRLTVEFWTNTLLKRFSVYAPPYKHNGQLWIRVSAQIYNDINDFEDAADVFITICNELNGQEVLSNSEYKSSLAMPWNVICYFFPC